MARSTQEDQRRSRRRTLLKGFLLGGAAVGLPALANALVARRSRRLDPPGWGRTRRFAWRLGDVSYQMLGEGEPILVLHSFGPGHDSEEWHTVAEILAYDHRVYAVDLLGWGLSHRPGLTYDDELYIELIRDFLADVVGERSVVAAAGLSAAYAVQVAVDHPELVTALALVTPSGIEVHGDEPDIKDALLYGLLRLPVIGTSALNLYTSRAAIQHHLRREIDGAPERVDARLVEHHHRSSHQPGSHSALAAYLCGYLNHPVEDLLPRLKVPLWIAWGSRSTAPPIAIADLWIRQIPEAELEVFRNTGNLPHEERAGRFCDRLARFLAGRHVSPIEAL
jgi:pimeloyl-ACP methyl ester carboxylesterase